jgi:hypothetical protein
MIEKVFWRLSKKREETICIFPLMIVKGRDRFRVEELVEESTAPPPLAPVSGKADNVPRVDIHP